MTSVSTHQSTTHQSTTPSTPSTLSTPQSQQRRPLTTNNMKVTSSINTPRHQSTHHSKINKENGINQSTKSPLANNKLSVSKIDVINNTIRSPLANRNANVTQPQASINQPVKRAILVNKPNAVAGVRKAQLKPLTKPQPKPSTHQSTLQKEVASLTSALLTEQSINAKLRAEIDQLRCELAKALSQKVMCIDDDDELKDFWHPVAAWDYYDAVNSHASSASDSDNEENEDINQQHDDQQHDDQQHDDDSCDDEQVTDEEDFADDELLTEDEQSDSDDSSYNLPSQPTNQSTRISPTLINVEPAATDIDEFSQIAERLSQLRVTPSRAQKYESGVLDIMTSPDSTQTVRHQSINLSSLGNVRQLLNDSANDSASETDNDESSINVSQVKIDSTNTSPSYHSSTFSSTPSTNRSESHVAVEIPSDDDVDASETDVSDSEDDDATVSDVSADEQVNIESTVEEEEVEHDESIDDGVDDDVDDGGSSQGFVDVFPYERNLYMLSRHYHLHNRLYSCPDAVTFKATHIQSKQLVVIKISEGYSHSGYLSGNLASHPKEVRLLSSAQGHSNIMEMTGWFGFPATRCYAFVTRYIENVSVENLFDNPELIRIYMRDLLTGIAHLHSRNILYRDLKPSNVLWNEETNKATIIDFDVATYFNHEGGHASHVGTFGYMAPEMDGETRYTLAVDMYAAGIVFGSLLFGFHEDEVADRERTDTKGAAMIDRVLAFSQQFNGRIGADFHLLLRLLTEDPSLRITVQEALQHPYITQERC